MLRLLDVGPGCGCSTSGPGSGWTTALLAALVGPAGSVLGVEIDPRLAAWGSANLAAATLPWASIVEATPGVLGVPETRAVRPDPGVRRRRPMPEPLIDQLADPGRLVVPVRSKMTLVVLHDGEREVSGHGAYRFVPLL